MESMESMESLPNPKPLIPGWTSRPIPDFSLSATGLILLADLSTVAHRTALRGGSSWLDVLLLVPGLHYQQAADELAQGQTAVLQAVEIGRDGKLVSHEIVNRAVVNYILCTAIEGKTVVLDVGEVPVKSRGWRTRGPRNPQIGGGSGGRSGGGGASDDPDLGWAAHILYLASPVLTCAATVMIILLGDWWALALLIALMVSRLLNIFVIKQRSRPKPRILPPPFSNPIEPSMVRITQYVVDINPNTTVILRGASVDLQALTTTVWLRPKTHVEGYLEAVAKVLVYLVAACSENASQAGNLVLLVLVLSSAGLLALSNAQVKELRNGGRVVAPSLREKRNKFTGDGAGRRGGDASGGNVARTNAQRRETTETWPDNSDMSSLEGIDDSFGYRVQLDTRVGRLEVVARRDREYDTRGMV